MLTETDTLLFLNVIEIPILSDCLFFPFYFCNSIVLKRFIELQKRRKDNDYYHLELHIFSSSNRLQRKKNADNTKKKSKR